MRMTNIVYIIAVFIAVFVFYNTRKLISKDESYGTLFSNFSFTELDGRVHDGQVKAARIVYPACRMENCFSFSRCRNFTVYIYPKDPAMPELPENFVKILDIIRNSPYYTELPSDACIFVPSLNTINRDPLSPWFVNNLDAHLQGLPFWTTQPRTNIGDDSVSEPEITPGRNHLIFNLYSGTWPNYDEHDLRLNLGDAMLAKASASTSRFRYNFDVSFPLIPEQYPGEVLKNTAAEYSHSGRIQKKLLTSFKGKRYLVGIGSETRNALYHIHNGRDILIATTCKHMSNWNAFADPKCAADISYYDTLSYEALLSNSTFCLVPRGRRLGTYRFLEVMQTGCIPVILSNDLELPFSEVIDWSQAAILGDERMLSTLPELLRSVLDSRIIQMRERLKFLWDAYFHSLQAIVTTTLEIIRNRIEMRQKRDSIWNWIPGGLLVDSTVSIDDCDYPLVDLPDRCRYKLEGGFTVLLTIREPFCGNFESHLSRFASAFSASKLLRKVIIVWQCDQLPPSNAFFGLFFGSHPTVLSVPPARSEIFERKTVCLSDRFIPQAEIPTLAVWSIDLSARNISANLVDGAFHLWTEFPHRLVGLTARHHIWNVTTNKWDYSIDTYASEYYSIVLLNAAVYHRYYHTVYWSQTNCELRKIVDTLATGEDLLFNCIVGHFSHTAPIYVTNGNGNAESDYGTAVATELNSFVSAPSLQLPEISAVLTYRHTCLRAFVGHFSQSVTRAPRHSADIPFEIFHTDASENTYLPLYSSNLRWLVPAQ